MERNGQLRLLLYTEDPEEAKNWIAKQGTLLVDMMIVLCVYIGWRY